MEGERKRLNSQSYEPLVSPVATKRKAGGNSFLLALIYGAVNAVMCIPVLYGYAAIIFSSAVFGPFMPALAKLVLLSSVVHQTTFSLLSTLPFAIGQVQDAGLIFLSKITTNVARRLAEEDAPDEVVVATAVASTAIGTAALGLCLCAIGKGRLARFVSYLPMPVVGGYLGFIGFFCLEAGLGLCTGKVVDGPATWPELFNWHDVLLCLPGVLFGALLFWVGRSFAHFAALPAAIVAAPLLFYVGLGMSGKNLQDARDAGLVGASREPADWTEALSLYRPGLIRWDALPHQIPVWLGMVVVVAFSSSLDVAAIEMDMGRPLDTNAELVTVGIGNMASGLTGGFTGSYIFSQTIFTYRTKCRSRLVGWIVMLSELAVFLMRADPLMYVPLFFFAATLIFIAIDLMVEWLVEVRHKLRVDEYLILLSTFAAIQVLELNLGLLLGLGLSILSFVVSYASESFNTVHRVFRRSRVLRPATQRQVLLRLQDKIVCMELSGELFFGSSVQILEQVRSLLGLTGTAAAAAAGTAEFASSPGVQFAETVSGLWKRRGRKSLSDTDIAEAGMLLAGTGNGSVAGVADTAGGGGPGGSEAATALGRYGAAEAGGPGEERTYSLNDIPSTPSAQNGDALTPRERDRDSGGQPAEPAAGAAATTATATTAAGGDQSLALRLQRARSTSEGGTSNRGSRSRQPSEGNAADRAHSMANVPGNMNDEGIPSFIVLDCARVTKLDASAARTCFLPLQRLTESHNGICVAYAALEAPLEALLRAHGCLEGERVQLFSDVHAALDWCETALIRAATAPNEGFRALGHFGKRMSFRPAKLDMPGLLRDTLELDPSDDGTLEGIENYSHDATFQPGEEIFAPGDSAEEFFVLLNGDVLLSGGPMGRAAAAAAAASHKPPGIAVAVMDSGSGGRGARARSSLGGEMALRPGSVFGQVDFALEGPRTSRAVAATESTVCVFTRDALDVMMDEDPRLLALLYKSVHKYSSLELVSTPF